MEFDKKYKVWSWKHWMIMHWIINPGLAVNELLFGQRIPKIMLVDQTKKGIISDRSYVPCPHCETIHDARIWSFKNGTAFKNWFGYFCPTCHKVIPCILNVFTFLLLAVTAPIWYWFKDFLFQKWLQKQPRRFQKLKIEETDFNRKKTLQLALGFGSMMFIFHSAMMFLVLDVEFSLRMLAINLIIWSLGGFFFAYGTKFLLRANTSK